MFNALEGDSFNRAITVIKSNTFFRSCIFRDLSVEHVPENPGEWEARVGALHVAGLNATLALENCTLSNIVNPLPLVIGRGGLVYSDNPDHVVRFHHHQLLDCLNRCSRPRADQVRGEVPSFGTTCTLHVRASYSALNAETGTIMVKQGRTPANLMCECGCRVRILKHSGLSRRYR